MADVPPFNYEQFLVDSVDDPERKEEIVAYLESNRHMKVFDAGMPYCPPSGKYSDSASEIAKTLKEYNGADE